MKTLCLILSLIVLSLSTVPCCSDDNCNDDIKTEQTSNQSQDHNEGNCNTCSPFLNCGTCAGFVFGKSSYEFKEVSFVSATFIACYKSQLADDYFAKIWQPPKIG
jgi:hypothetical protein